MPTQAMIDQDARCARSCCASSEPNRDRTPSAIRRDAGGTGLGQLRATATAARCRRPAWKAECIAMVFDQSRGGWSLGGRYSPASTVVNSESLRLCLVGGRVVIHRHKRILLARDRQAPDLLLGLQPVQQIAAAGAARRLPQVVGGPLTSCGVLSCIASLPCDRTRRQCSPSAHRYEDYCTGRSLRLGLAHGVGLIEDHAPTSARSSPAASAAVTKRSSAQRTCPGLPPPPGQPHLPRPPAPRSSRALEPVILGGADHRAKGLGELGCCHGGHKWAPCSEPCSRRPNSPGSRSSAAINGSPRRPPRDTDLLLCLQPELQLAAIGRIGIFPHPVGTLLNEPVQFFVHCWCAQHAPER